MPRYRYRKVFIASPCLHSPAVEMKRVGDAIAVVDALGRGSVTLQAKDSLQATIPIEHLRGKNTEAIWHLFDGEIDVAHAIQVPSLTHARRVDPAAFGRWPMCPSDVMSTMNGLLPDSIYRLRHFGAIMVLGLKIGEFHFAMRPLDRAFVDAGLTELERTIATAANRSSALKDLLWLR